MLHGHATFWRQNSVMNGHSYKLETCTVTRAEFSGSLGQIDLIWQSFRRCNEDHLTISWFKVVLQVRFGFDSRPFARRSTSSRIRIASNGSRTALWLDPPLLTEIASSCHVRAFTRSD